MFNKKRLTLLSTAMAVSVLGSGCGGDSKTSSPSGPQAFQKPSTYTGFPITLAGGTSTSGTSVSYKGQMARHVLREQVKQIIKVTDATTEAEAIEAVNLYLKNTDGAADAISIIAPVGNTYFDIKETLLNELSTGKSLYNSLYDTDASGSQADPIPGVSNTDRNVTMGVPGNKTAKEVMDLWVANFARNHVSTSGGYIDMEFGYDYQQLFPKFIMGAVFYNQAVDKYLDEYITTPSIKDNGTAYKPGKHYTGKEHSWDEGFGYFGAAANYSVLTAEQNYKVKKQDGTVFANADWDGDGKVSLYTEYTSGPAYYTASFDKDTTPITPSSYGADMMSAWLTGRTLITNTVDASGNARNLTDAERVNLVAQATIIKSNWEMVLAEAVYKYIGQTHEKIVDLQQNVGDTTKIKSYFKAWAEAKGFMLSLQYGGSVSKINKTKFDEIDSIIGYGPVLEDGSQVNGVSANTFSKSTTNAEGLNSYKNSLKAVQTKLDALYTLKVKQHSIP